MSKEKQKILSSTLVDNAILTPRSFARRNINESGITYLTSSMSSVFTENMEKNKENVDDTIFAVPFAPAFVIRKAQSLQTVSDKKSTSSKEFQVSPGTGASVAKLNAKIASLREREERRKKIQQKAERNKEEISFPHIMQKFLEETDKTLKGVENSVFSSNLYCEEDCTITNGKTYLIEGKPYVFHEKPECEQMEDLKFWINFMIKEVHDNDEYERDPLQKKIDADACLRNLLLKNETAEGSCNTIEKKKSHKPFKYRVSEWKWNAAKLCIRRLYDESKMENKIMDLVSREEICVRSDKKIHSNIGLQVEILKILLSFNIFWLLFALETLFLKEISHTENSSLYKQIILFLKGRLFRDPEIMRKPKLCSGRNKTVITDLGSKKLLQHFLEKMCEILYIFEISIKCEELPFGKPCLFRKDSIYKSLEEVISSLSKQCISGTCNLSKSLARIGFEMNYRQKFPDEYRYTIEDIRNDLRDGMILGKLLEKISNLKKNTVIQHLREPLDRLRKIYNLNTVLRMAGEAGIDIGTIKSEDILRFRTQKVMELIWRFIGVFTGKIYSRNKSKEVCLTDYSAHRRCIKDPLNLLKKFDELGIELGIPRRISSLMDLADGKFFSMIWSCFRSNLGDLDDIAEKELIKRVADAANREFGLPLGILLNSIDEKSLYLFAQLFMAEILALKRNVSAARTIQRAFRNHLNRRNKPMTIIVENSNSESSMGKNVEKFADLLKNKSVDYTGEMTQISVNNVLENAMLREESEDKRVSVSFETTKAENFEKPIEKLSKGLKNITLDDKEIVDSLKNVQMSEILKESFDYYSLISEIDRQNESVLKTVHHELVERSVIEAEVISINEPVSTDKSNDEDGHISINEPVLTDKSEGYKKACIFYETNFVPSFVILDSCVINLQSMELKSSINHHSGHMSDVNKLRSEDGVVFEISNDSKQDAISTHVRGSQLIDELNLGREIEGLSYFSFQPQQKNENSLVEAEQRTANDERRFQVEQPEHLEKLIVLNRQNDDIGSGQFIIQPVINAENDQFSEKSEIVYNVSGDVENILKEMEVVVQVAEAESYKSDLEFCGLESIEEKETSMFDRRNLSNTSRQTEGQSVDQAMHFSERKPCEKSLADILYESFSKKDSVEIRASGGILSQEKKYLDNSGEHNSDKSVLTQLIKRHRILQKKQCSLKKYLSALKKKTFLR